MCGRYALHADPDVVALHFGIGSIPAFSPRYNICPGADILAVRTGGARMLRWGRIANARAETIAEKPVFASAFRRFRCLVPASGFYEWQSTGGRKQPYYVRPADVPLFALAAIVLLWKGKRSVSLITTVPNELMRPIHDRMPVIVAPEDHAAWLDSSEDARGLLRAYPAERMRAHPVSPRVSRPEHDDATLIERFSAPTS